MAQEQYLEAIKNYTGYSTTAGKILAELYRTSVNLQTTLTTQELAEKLGLEYANTAYAITNLLKNHFLKESPEFRRPKKYNISQDKLDELVTIYKAKNS